MIYLWIKVHILSIFSIKIIDRLSLCIYNENEVRDNFIILRDLFVNANQIKMK